MTKNILKKAMMMVVAMMLPLMAFAQKQTFALYDEPTGCPDWEPELTVFVAKNPNGMAILACPGGGYHGLAMDHEGFNMADWFNAQGITYGVLRYRMPHGDKTAPLADASKAMRIMRSHAEEWHIDKIGVMGSSAGGHLASTLSTHYADAETRPDFQILFYPVISMDLAITHRGSHDNLLGKNPSATDEELFSNEKQVNANTPPAFVMHSFGDNVVPIENSINYVKALVDNGVKNCSVHFYPVGGHGWGYNDSFIYKRQWTGELEKWLRELRRVL
ncbi:MAG: alpha/beta hydrolase [Muribaculaceae bacterium]